MAQQINLYDPALLKARDWLALGNVILAAGVLTLIIGGAGLMVRNDLPALQARVAGGETQLQAVREQVVVLAQRVEDRRSDPKIETALAQARHLADMRGEVLQALRQRLGSEPPAYFADYLRGFSRQSLTGLWLTGFSYDAASSGMEIDGRTIDPALLPEYIRRLNREPAFRGLAFAALKLDEGKIDPAGTSTTTGTPREAQKAPFHNFTLVPVKQEEAAGKKPAG